MNDFPNLFLCSQQSTILENTTSGKFWAPNSAGPVCIAHPAHPIATPLISSNFKCCTIPEHFTQFHVNFDQFPTAVYFFREVIHFRSVQEQLVGIKLKQNYQTCRNSSRNKRFPVNKQTNKQMTHLHHSFYHRKTRHV